MTTSTAWEIICTGLLVEIFCQSPVAIWPCAQELLVGLGGFDALLFL